MNSNGAWPKESWPSIRSHVAARWPEIEIRELDYTPLGIDRLVGLVQARYGLPLDIATRQVVDFFRTVSQ